MDEFQQVLNENILLQQQLANENCHLARTLYERMSTSESLRSLRELDFPFQGIALPSDTHEKRHHDRIKYLLQHVPLKSLVELICQYGSTYHLHCEHAKEKLESIQPFDFTNAFLVTCKERWVVLKTLILQSQTPERFLRFGRKRFRGKENFFHPNDVKPIYLDLLSNGKWYKRLQVCDFIEGRKSTLPDGSVFPIDFRVDVACHIVMHHEEPPVLSLLYDELVF